MANIQKTDSDIKNFISLIHNKGELANFSEDIFLISLDVAGTSFVKDIEILEPELIKGTKLKFIREAKNVHDDRAILVQYDGYKLGYVPKISNEILANLMDAGKYLYGVVEFSKYRNDWLQINFKVFLQD